MSVIIKIAGIDRTTLIDWRSFRLQRALTSQIDTLTFDIKRFGTKIFKPDLLDDIEFFDGASKLFAGKVVGTEDFVKGSRLQTVQVRCKDNTHEMDKALVVKTFENETVENIIEV